MRFVVRAGNIVALFFDMILIKFGLFLAFSLFPIGPLRGANILGLFPLNFTSHYIIFDSILRELATRGHIVTVANPFPISQKLKNFNDVDVSECAPVPGDAFSMDEAYKYSNTWIDIPWILALSKLSEQILLCSPVQKLLHSNQTFDLIITEIFGGDAMFGFALKYGAPVVSFCAEPLYPWAAYRVGNPFNPSYMSHPQTNLPLQSHNLSFYHRLYNTLMYLYSSSLYYYYSYTVDDPVIRKHIAPDLPPLVEVVKNTSLVLTFSHFSLNEPVPLVPNVIEIAGVQIKDSKPVPQVCVTRNCNSYIK